MKFKNALVVGFAIFLLAAVLRLFNLNSLPIFADEAIYVRWAQVMAAVPSLRFLPLSDGKQPFFMWLLIPALKLFSDPLLAGRTLSALASLGTVAGVGLAAFILFKNLRLAAIAALLWAVLPYAVFFERMALTDALLTLFYIWTFNFLALTILHQRLDTAMLGGFTLGFAWLTKSPAIFALILSPSLLLLARPSSRKKFFMTCGLLLVAFTIAYGMYNILRLGPEFHMIALRNKDYVYSFSEALITPLDPLVPHLKDSSHFYFYFLTPLGLLFALWGLADGQRHHLRQRLILATWVLLPVLIQSFIAKGFTARYLLFTAPFAAILIAHSVEHIGQKTKKHILTYLASGLVLAISLFIDFQIIFSPQSAPLPRIERAGYLEEWTAGFGLKEVSNYIRQSATAGPVVVGSEGFFGTPFNALELYLNDLPQVRITGVGVWVDSAPDRLISALDENQVFLVINSTRFYSDPDNTPGLKLISSYPKAVRPDSSREELLFFQVVKP